MWMPTFNAMHDLLTDPEPAGLRTELESLATTSPRMHAAMAMLALALEDTLGRLDEHEPDSELIVTRLPQYVLDLLVSSPLVISRERLCQILDRFAARQAFRDFARTGQPREPSPGCRPSPR